MKKDLIQAIKTILESIEEIQEVYMYPLPGSPKKYPAAICVSDNIDNSFETTKDNFKVYRFKIWLQVNIAGTTEEEAFENILPGVSDAVIAKFDAEWNGGTVNGHRVWQIISGGFTGYQINEKSKTAFEELTLTVKMASSI